MKKLVCIALTMVLLLAVGCNGSTGTPSDSDGTPSGTPTPSQGVDLSTSEIMDKIKDGAGIEDMGDVEADMFGDLFNFSSDLIDEWLMIRPDMGMAVFEVAVFIVKDTGSIDDMKADFERRSEEIYEQYEDYNPQGADAAKDYRVETNGKYVLFVMAAEADEIVEAFDNVFK